MSCPHGNPIGGCDTCDEVDAAFEAGKRSALAEQPAQMEQEPVAWMHWLHGPVRLFFNKDEAQMELERLNREHPVDVGSRKMRPLVFGDTSPPAQRKPLTDEQINKAAEDEDNETAFLVGFYAGARFAEAAHGIKENT